MTPDPEKSLTENLAEIGCTHQPSRISGKREIYRADGTLVGTFDAFEAWDELGKRPAFFKPMEPS